MADRNQQFLRELKKFPEEVQFYIDSKLLSQHNHNLGVKYKTKEGFFAELFIDTVLEKFRIDNLEKKISNELKRSPAETKLISAEFIGMILLPIDKYLSEVSFEEEVRRQGKNPAEYQPYVKELIEAIEKEKDNLLDELSDKYDSYVNVAEEKKAALNLFNNNLVDILRYGTAEPLAGLNASLLYLLYYEEGFKEDLVNVMLSNRELITKEDIIVKEKAIEPSIGNWLRDFIGQIGSSMVDNLSLTQYMTNSKNTKKIKAKDKKNLSKLFELYRNIKFYPESLENIPVESWEIFPTEKGQIIKQKKPLVGPLKAEALESVGQLKEQADQYSEGSLERRAIEEEIKRIEKL